jgi:hypothetical protein
MQKNFHRIDLLPRGSGKSFNMDMLLNEVEKPVVIATNRSQRRKEKYKKVNRRGGKINEQY